MEFTEKRNQADMIRQIASEKHDTKMTLIVSKGLYKLMKEHAAEKHISVNEFAIKAFCKALAE